jgi:transposase
LLLMLTREEDIDAHALRRQGWTISAIAKHLGRDRKTIRAYLNDERVAGERKPAGADPFELFTDYVRARLTEDPHLWAVTLFDEVVELGYDRSYQTFTRQIRDRELRPYCEPCAGTKGRASTVIPHPPGEETQWDWLELPDPPKAWGWGSTAHLLVGSLACSSKWRAVLAPSEDQAQLVNGLDAVARKLGGLTKAWRFDRMATVCHPTTGKVTASFAAVAKHYGVSVKICPPRRGNRKGVVEKANHTAAQRCWRTLPDDATIEQAQAVFDKFAQLRGDTRLRPVAGSSGKATVATVAKAEPLAPVPPAPFPATLTEQRVVSAQALVAWRGNFYSVPPELARASVSVSQQLGSATVEIATPSGIIIARHQVEPDGAGVMVRDHGHVVALERLVLAGHDTRTPHRRKERIPPGTQALAAAEILRSRRQPTDPLNAAAAAAEVVIDLTKYAHAAEGRNTLP